MESSSFASAVSALKHGDAVVFPTDTVYGLGVSVVDAEDPSLIYSIKGRDEGKPVAWLVGDASALNEYGKQVPDYAHQLAASYWPGALTLIVTASDSVSRAFSSRSGTIGLRMPNNATALSLLHFLGCPIATSSANISGRPATGAFDQLDPDVIARVGAVLEDSNDTDESGIASTVVDCTGPIPSVVREGPVSYQDIMLHL